jgi:nucleotide-binding universal stress UspA family protein
MQTLKSALVATDFSVEAMSATHRAASIARETGLKGALAHVLPSSLPVEIHVQAAPRAQQALSVMAEKLQHGGASFAPRLLEGRDSYGMPAGRRLS